MRANVGMAAIIASLLVLPLAVLQLTNRNVAESFPFVLFGVLWLLPFVFVLILASMARTLRTRTGQYRWLTLVPAVAVLALIASFWTGLVLDQMPCFLGVPNCD